jgi:hypothetical protein
MTSTLSLGDLLPAAVGIALSPVPIAAVILMLFSARARTNGPVFVLGWLAGLVIVGAAILLLGGGSAGSSDDPSTLSLVVKTILGALLLFVAVRQWRARPGSDEEPPVPKWMQAIDGFTAVKSFGMAALLSGVNPKNLALNAAGMIVIAEAEGLSTGATWAWFAVFVVMASLTVIAPVAYYLIAGKSAAATLDSMKTWLLRNNAVVMSVLLLIFGVKLLAQGLQGLLA